MENYTLERRLAARNSLPNPVLRNAASPPEIPALSSLPTTTLFWLRTAVTKDVAVPQKARQHPQKSISYLPITAKQNAQILFPLELK